MIDIKLIRENRELVKENIKKKFQDKKLPLVDEIYELDLKFRETKGEADKLRAEKNSKSALIGKYVREGNTEEVEKIKNEVSAYGDKINELEILEEKLENDIK